MKTERDVANAIRTAVLAGTGVVDAAHLLVHDSKSGGTHFDVEVDGELFTVLVFVPQ